VSGVSIHPVKFRPPADLLSILHDRQRNTKNWWNVIYRGKQSCSNINLSQWHISHRLTGGRIQGSRSEKFLHYCTEVCFLQHASSPLIHVWHGRNKILITSATPVFLKLLVFVPPPPHPLNLFVCPLYHPS
jgi:hypothetical protein